MHSQSTARPGPRSSTATRGAAILWRAAAARLRRDGDALGTKQQREGPGFVVEHAGVPAADEQRRGGAGIEPTPRSDDPVLPRIVQNVGQSVPDLARRLQHVLVVAV